MLVFSIESLFFFIQFFVMVCSVVFLSVFAHTEPQFTCFKVFLMPQKGREEIDLTFFVGCDSLKKRNFAHSETEFRRKTGTAVLSFYAAKLVEAR